ncbi:HU family DNA-binding protein [Pseudorhodobacter sp.]|uniref:HU family DNA-binding protein n=1 Tax=Pseudorhodobacter sp. TaxID=1934400 RepID=UPI0026489150|nr:HU family DNA-binding protein [Pseudorhodobacter sp.]MDN5785725.1 HU family DNA-binding protein [Pseudorhodobacter sp.]
MGTVSKSDIIRDTAEKTGTSAAAAKEIVEAFLGLVSERAEAGETVSLIGFGRFSVKDRPARVGRNPATGAPVDIPASRKLTFKPSKKAA